VVWVLELPSQQVGARLIVHCESLAILRALRSLASTAHTSEEISKISGVLIIIAPFMFAAIRQMHPLNPHHNRPLICLTLGEYDSSELLIRSL
jgi:hypothetical protein